MTAIALGQLVNAPYYYSYTALRPVVNYVSRPLLHRQIKEQLYDGRYDAIETRILAVQGLGGSGKSKLVLNYVREYREDYSTIFLVTLSLLRCAQTNRGC